MVSATTAMARSINASSFVKNAPDDYRVRDECKKRYSSSSSSSLQTSVMVQKEKVCSNLPKQASAGKVCIYVCSKHKSLTKFSFAKHPKEKEKQGFPNQTNKWLIIAY
jgi:hypothetical protein